MKKEYRVKSEKDFQDAFQNGTSYANRQLVLYVYPKIGQVHFRVGLSVGKKMGNAVQRNKIKRFLRHAIHELSPVINNEYDYLIIARKDIVNRNFYEIKKSLVHVMKIASIIDIKKLEELQ